MTLYLYLSDTAGDSTCYDAGAVAWPPLLTRGAPTASGSADKSQLSTVTRNDGATMVKYGAWPPVPLRQGHPARRDHRPRPAGCLVRRRG